ncbi:hypothetical protein HZ326_29109 [Fusarium oxysporum f. sp. albedinis]|nr:hypothetical protein HZ326_29109 [Fusarium oxysporum f. sp. albedinis]
MNFTVQVGKSTTWKMPVDGGNPLVACIEPYDNQFRFPVPVLNALKELLGVDDALINPSLHPDIYSVEPGLVYDSSSNISFSMTMTIEDGLEVNIPSHELGMFV